MFGRNSLSLGNAAGLEDGLNEAQHPTVQPLFPRVPISAGVVGVTSRGKLLRKEGCRSAVSPRAFVIVPPRRGLDPGDIKSSLVHRAAS